MRKLSRQKFIEFLRKDLDRKFNQSETCGCAISEFIGKGTIVDRVLLNETQGQKLIDGLVLYVAPHDTIRELPPWACEVSDLADQSNFYDGERRKLTWKAREILAAMGEPV